MQKKVETFLVKENANLVGKEPKTKEWKELVEELGLSGQKALTMEAKNNEPVPFTYMKTQMRGVLNTLCPVKVAAADYNVEAIPLEALAMFKLAKDYFERVEIWYDDEAPDPVMVGLLKPEEWNLENKKPYLIARWGAELADWDKLYKEALKRLTTEKTELLELKLAKVQAQLKTAHNDAREQLRGKWVSWEH